MGQQFVAPAFITVVVGGGASVIGGAVGSSGLLSLVETPVSVDPRQLLGDDGAAAHGAAGHPRAAGGVSSLGSAPAAGGVR